MERWVRRWVFRLALLVVILAGVTLGMLSIPGELSLAWAGAPLGQSPIAIDVDFCSKATDPEFVPAPIALKSGKRYLVSLKNPTTHNHYFTFKDFAGAVWTQKVEAGEVEVKGVVHELELHPQTAAEWLFLAIRPGVYHLRCSVQGQEETGQESPDAGITGTLEITS